MVHRLAGLVAAALLSGCAGMGVQPGAPEAEARRAMGTPATEYTLADGTRQLVYPTGPLGTQTFMVYVSNGSVQRVQQVLGDDTFYRIQNGMSGDEVRRMIGPPWRVTRFDNLGQTAWDYRFRDTWGYLADFSAMIDDRGLVAGKVIVRIESGRDGMNR
jgi:hypothetical protein